MAYELGRFVYWVNQNSGAIQALSAVVIVILTGVLAWLTLKSVKAAEVAAISAQHQLEANLQPTLEMELKPGFDLQSNEGDHPFSKGANLKLRNVGSTPLKLRRVAMVIQRMRLVKDAVVVDYEYESEATEYVSRVLMPGGTISEDIIVAVQKREDQQASYALRVVCSDLSEITSHSFLWHPRTGISHCVERPRVRAQGSTDRR